MLLLEILRVFQLCLIDVQFQIGMRVLYVSVRTVYYVRFLFVFLARPLFALITQPTQNSMLDISIANRWLLSQGQTERAIVILRTFARINKKEVDETIYKKLKVNECVINCGRTLQDK